MALFIHMKVECTRLDNKNPLKSNTQVTSRPPLERMGARESMFGLVERCTSWFRKSFPWDFFESHSIVELVQVYTGGFQAGLPHGQATLEHPSGWRLWFYLSRVLIKIVSSNVADMSENLWRGRCMGRGRSRGRTEPPITACSTTGRWLERGGESMSDLNKI